MAGFLTGGTTKQLLSRLIDFHGGGWTIAVLLPSFLLKSAFLSGHEEKDYNTQSSCEEIHVALFGPLYKAE